MNTKHLLSIKSHIEKLTHLYENQSKYMIETLPSKIFSAYLVSFDTISSTHTFAEKFEISEIPDNSVIIFKSDSQFKPIGQRTNTFISPKGNLYCSLLIKTKTKEKLNLNLLPLITSLSVKQSLQEYTLLRDANQILPFQLKWINDIFIDEAKISGVLCSSSFECDEIKLILSAGVNINISPEVINRKICCLKSSLILKEDLSVDEYFRIYYNALLKNLHMFIHENNTETLMEEIIDSLAYKNELVDITDPVDESKIISGIFTGVDENGNALIESNGKKEKFSYGKMKKNQFSFSFNQKI